MLTQNLGKKCQKLLEHSQKKDAFFSDVFPECDAYPQNVDKLPVFLEPFFKKLSANAVCTPGLLYMRLGGGGEKASRRRLGRYFLGQVEGRGGLPAGWPLGAVHFTHLAMHSL